MKHRQLRFLFLNAGHFLDHLFVLIFATAALRLTHEWGLDYAALIPYATPGFIAFGVGAIPAGWLADRWSREGMLVVFFIGIGVSSILAGFSDGPVEIAVCLTLVGAFAAIYHPVGLAMVVEGIDRTGMPLAVNGIFGNMGVASAALLTGFLLDAGGWRLAFILPGVLSMVLGLAFWRFCQGHREPGKNAVPPGVTGSTRSTGLDRALLLRIFAIILFTTALGGLVFQSTTFALPKVFDERLTEIAGSATWVGVYAFIVFSVAALAQLVVGYLVDRHSARVVLAAVAALQALFFVLMIELSGLAALLVAIGFMLVVFGQIPINDVLVGRIARSEWRSRAYALRYVVTFTVMASALPLIAWLHETRGFEGLFKVLAITASTIFVAALLLPATRRILHATNTA